jgi:hypothetical protein
MVRYAYLLGLLFTAVTGHAQIPAEVFAGNRAAEYSFFWFESPGGQEKISLFNFTFFSLNYANAGENTYEIYQIATYNLSGNWGLAAGGRFLENEFTPLLGVSGQWSGKNLYVNLVPSVQYVPSAGRIRYGAFGLLTYRPPLTNTWSVFTQLMVEPLFQDRKHVFSYQQLRIGLGYKKTLQFGAGLNLEQLGESLFLRHNWGGFIRTEL